MTSLRLVDVLAEIIPVPRQVMTADRILTALARYCERLSAAAEAGTVR